MWEVSEDRHAYFTKIKVESQEISMHASYYPNERANRFYIDACVYSKRKRIDQDFCNKNRTGKHGLKPLLAIRKAIIELESFIAEKCNSDFEIIIYWTDNKRRDAYVFGLKDYGYRISKRYNKKCLVKKIISTAP